MSPQRRSDVPGSALAAQVAPEPLDAEMEQVLAAALEAVAVGRDAVSPDLLIEVLHEIHARCGEIPSELVPALARALNLSRADVHGVITFYRDFDAQDSTAVQLCVAEACQAQGARALHARLQAEGTSVREVYCLGLCAIGPAQVLDAPATSATAARAAEAPTKPLGHATLFVSSDSVAIAQGADALAAHLESLGHTLTRNGTRGLLWLEPLIEVADPAAPEDPEARLAFGPVCDIADLDALLDAGLATSPEAVTHPLALGRIGALSELQRQDRWAMARIGVADPLDADAYLAHGGGAGIAAAHAMAPRQVVQTIIDSGLRGRGGAGFPAGLKWKTVADAITARTATHHTGYIVANADEGDSGTFADRILMEADPFTLIEGMAIAAYATGAQHGVIYIRSEYPRAIQTMQQAIRIARTRGWLGKAAWGASSDFDIEVRRGAGAYICGEETSMLNSIEGKRGVVRAKPPIPALAGLHGQPTVVNNVLTLATAPAILSRGAAAFSALGNGCSRGTQVFQLSGNIARPGIYEAPLGMSLRELVHDMGGGTRSGRDVGAVQVGGPLGAYILGSDLDHLLGYEELAPAGAALGHGGVVVFDDSIDLLQQAEYAMAFCAHESCGLCTPCRIGSVRGRETLAHLRTLDPSDPEAKAAHELIDELCEVMVEGSMCAMGSMTPIPVQSLLRAHREGIRPGEGGPQ